MLLFIANTGFNHHVYSQTDPNVTTAQQLIIDEGIRRQEEKDAEYLKKLEQKDDVLTPEISLDMSKELPTESPCFDIQKIIFTGDKEDVFFWLKDEIKPYINKCIGVLGIQKILNILNTNLIDDGYITSRITAPEQNLKNGEIRLHIHVGKISEIRMILKGDPLKKEDNSWGTWKNAFPISVGDVLNIKHLEQGVEQMKRLPSQKLTTLIEPGNLPNTSIIFIEREESGFFKRMRFGTTLDNSGSKVMGRTQLSSYLAFDNPLGLNDIISASAIGNAENINEEHHSQSFNLHYSIPYKYSTFSLTNSYSRYAQWTKLTTYSILSKGNSNKIDARWDHTVLRNTSSKLGIYYLVSVRHANSYINNVEIIVQRRRTTNLESGLNFKKLIGKAGFDFNIAYREGSSWFNAQPDFDQNKTNGLTLRPNIWLLNAGYNHLFLPWNYPIQISSQSRLQHTNNKTTSIDQFAIGNRYSVRGFDGDNVLIAENGYSVKNDISVPIKYLPTWISLITYAGADYGYVWGPNDKYLVGQDLAGAVAGVKGKLSILQFDVAVAAPIYKPQKFNSSIWNMYLSLSVNL